jgi:hypothetical protein
MHTSEAVPATIMITTSPMLQLIENQLHPVEPVPVTAKTSKLHFVYYHTQFGVLEECLTTLVYKIR